MKVVARETLVLDIEEISLTESANKRNGENIFCTRKEMATFCRMIRIYWIFEGVSEK